MAVTQKENLELESENQLLKERIKQLGEDVLRIIRKEFKQICCYCGWESEEGQWEELQAHLRECKQHPLYQALERIKKLEEGIKKVSHLLESPRIEWATKNAIVILNDLLEKK